MLRSVLLAVCLLLSTATAATLTLAEMGIAPDGRSRLRNPDGSIHRVKFTPGAKPAGRAIVADRQTSRRDIVARQVQRPKWKRAYNSLAACGGYAGQNIHLKANANGATSYVTSDGDGPTLGGSQGDAVTLTVNGDCNLVTQQGKIANIIASDPTAVYFDFQADITEYNYKKLVCTATPGNYELQCTANGISAFCTDTEDHTAFFLATSCLNLVTLTVSVVDP